LQEIRIADGLLFEQVYGAVEDVLQRKFEIEIIVGILLDRHIVEGDDQIHVAFGAETVGEYEPKAYNAATWYLRHSGGKLFR
jgi:hypothetical protein